MANLTPPLQNFKTNIDKIDDNTPDINLPQVADFVMYERSAGIYYPFDNNKYTEVVCKIKLDQYTAGFPYAFTYFTNNYHTIGSYTSTQFNSGQHIYSGSYILHYQVKSVPNENQRKKIKVTITSDMQMSWKEDWGMMGIPSFTERTFEVDSQWGFNQVGMTFVDPVESIGNQSPPFHVTVWAK